MNAFKYLPLQGAEIRTLHLLPGQFEDPLEGYLLRKRFRPAVDDVPRYAALSYVWDDQSDRELLNVPREGWNLGSTLTAVEELNAGGWQPSHSTIAICRNLASALRYIRSQTAAIYLWCDSVCIYQDDLTE
jgi:hypothetical protein